MPDLSPAARTVLDALTAASGRWVIWRDCVPGATDPSHVLAYVNELRARGHDVQRRGRREVEEYRLLQREAASIPA